MNLKYIVLTLSLLISPATFAATDFTATGQGESSAKPDQFSITIGVQSRCYKAARDAVAANAKFADAVDVILKKYVLTADDSIVKMGTSNIRFDEMPGEYDPTSGKTRILCDGYFAEDSLTLVTDAKNASSYPEIVFAYYELMDAQTQGYENTTTGTLGTSVALLKNDTRDRINAEALASATMNALENVRLMATRCGVDIAKQDVALLSVSEGINARSPLLGDEGVKRSIPMAQAAGSGPQFGVITVTKYVTIVARPGDGSSALLRNCSVK